MLNRFFLTLTPFSRPFRLSTLVIFVYGCCARPAGIYSIVGELVGLKFGHYFTLKPGLLSMLSIVKTIMGAESCLDQVGPAEDGTRREYRSPSFMVIYGIYHGDLIIHE